MLGTRDALADPSSPDSFVELAPPTPTPPRRPGRLGRDEVYIDLSGWRPKYFPPELSRAAGGLLRTKAMFGSDYPLITPEPWLADFDDLGIDAAYRPAIMKGTAARLLGLSRDNDVGGQGGTG